MSLYLEFDALVRRFAEENLRYAVVGALAVGIYGRMRATEDMDFLVHPEDLESTLEVVKGLGYRPAGEPWVLEKAQMELYRFVRPVENTEDLHIVDLLVPATSQGLGYLARAEVSPYADISIRVVSKADLVEMKRFRGSKQDEADIEDLQDGT